MDAKNLIKNLGFKRIAYFHPMRIRLYWLPVFLLLTIAAFFAYKALQAPLSYELAPAFDGNEYTLIYNYFTGNSDSFDVSFPFHQRIFVPYLASLINTEVIHDFQWINLAFSLLTVWMLFKLWRELGFELKWFWAGFVWLIFHWTGMIRLNAFDPITVDVPTYFFQAVFLWVVLKRKFVHLLWLAPLATCQKESFVALPIILFVYAWWHNRKTEEGFYKLYIIAGSAVLALAAQWFINFYFPPIEAGKGALITIGYHAKQALLNPFEIVRWLAAISMAFGPAIWWVINRYRKHYYYDNTRNLLVIFTALYLAFGILAGGDMTRIVYLGFPFIATWLIYELQQADFKKCWLLIVFSLPLMMLHAAIPDPAFQWETWENWYPEFAQTEIVLTLLAYVFAASLILLNTNRSKKY